MKDYIVRAMSKDGFIKATAITGQGMVERGREIHNCSPIVTAALGRVLLGCSMIGNDLKGKGASVTLRINGGGPCGTLLAVSDPEGNVRGYVDNPLVELKEKRPGKMDVGWAVGNEGTITVIKDYGMKEPYVGTVGLMGGEIAEDIAGYYVESEQIPTACALGVLVDTDLSVKCAGGYIIQLLPGAPDEVITKLEHSITKLGPVTPVLEQGYTPEMLLEAVLSDFELVIFERQEVSYKCYCSRERVIRALSSITASELQIMINEDNGTEVSCQFCDKKHSFTAKDLQKILDSQIAKNN